MDGLHDTTNSRDDDSEEWSVILPNQPFHLGFLVAQRFSGLGFCGGYLIVNEWGHPCEFHCSMPLQPTRTQEILYGERLNSYLIGHQLVPALLAKATLQPAIVILEQWDALPPANCDNVPFAIVQPESEPVPVGWSHQAAGNQVLLWFRDQTGLPAVQAFAQQYSLTEPFQRIREALVEAQSSVAA